MQEHSVKKLYIILLFLLIVFHGINNYIWLNKDGLSMGFDVIHQLDKNMNFFDSLVSFLNMRFLTIGSFLTGFLSLFKASGSCWPSLVHFVTSIFNLIFGLSPTVTRMSNMLYFTILIISVFMIGKELADYKMGLLAAFLISFYPGIFGLSRRFGIHFPLVAMVALGMFFLLKTNNFSNRKYSLIFGSVFGLGILTDARFVFFVVGPLIYITGKGLFCFKDKQTFLLRFQNIIFSLGLAALISSIWWWGALRFLWLDVWPIVIGSYGYGKVPLEKIHPALQVVYIKPFSFAWFSFYLAGIISHIGTIFFLIFVVSFFAFFRFNKKREKILVVLWLIVPYIIHTLISVKWCDFYFPAFPAIALISAFGILRIKTYIIKTPLIILLIVIALIQFYVLSYPLKFKHRSFLIPIPPNIYNPYDVDWASYPSKDNSKEITLSLANIINSDISKDKTITIGMAIQNKFYGHDFCVLFKYLMSVYRNNILWIDIYNRAHSDYYIYNNVDYFIIVQAQDLEVPVYDELLFFAYPEAECPEKKDIFFMRRIEELRIGLKEKYRVLKKGKLIKDGFSNNLCVYLVGKNIAN